MNVEGRRNEFYLFYKEIEQSETTPRYSAVQYSTVLRLAFENPEPLNLFPRKYKGSRWFIVY
jgi:hypothetical protein